MDISTRSGLAAAVEWQRNYLARVAEGGMWIIPRTGTILRVSHKDKTLTVVANLLPELPDLRRVTVAMGWNFVDSEGAVAVPNNLN